VVQNVDIPAARRSETAATEAGFCKNLIFRPPYLTTKDTKNTKNSLIAIAFVFFVSFVVKN